MRAQRVLPAVAAGLVLVLAGCGVQKAGAASVVGDQVVSDRAVSDVLAELTDQLGAANVDVAAATPATVTRLTQQLVVAEAARRKGVQITPSDVSKLLQDTATQNSTTVAAIEDQLAAQAWVPRSQVADYATLYLEEQKLAAELGGGTGSDNGTAALQAYMGQVSADLGVQLAPRYGVWDDTTFGPGPGPYDLASPAPSASDAPLATDSPTPAPSATP